MRSGQESICRTNISNMRLRQEQNGTWKVGGRRGEKRRRLTEGLEPAWHGRRHGCRVPSSRQMAFHYTSLQSDIPGPLLTTSALNQYRDVLPLWRASVSFITTPTQSVESASTHLWQERSNKFTNFYRIAPLILLDATQVFSNRETYKVGKPIIDYITNRI